MHCKHRLTFKYIKNNMLGNQPERLPVNLLNMGHRRAELFFLTDCKVEFNDFRQASPAKDNRNPRNDVLHAVLSLKID